MEDMRVSGLVRSYEHAKSLRQPFDSDWESIRDLIRPISVSFNPQTGQYQTVRPDTQYDGTAGDALEELACAIHSYTSNPAERWFELQIVGRPRTNLEFEELAWLEHATEMIYAQFTNEDAHLNTSLAEVYMDLGSYGNGVMLTEWDQKINGCVFRAEPLGRCYYLENSQGQADTMYRELPWTLRQIKQEFGDVLPPKLMEAKDDKKTYTVIHAVHPRGDVEYGANAKRRPFASCWFCLETKELLSESGYYEFPFQVPRWIKLAGEAYGRGPANKCLPDIRMLNAMERTTIKAGQKQVDPPLVLADEGFLLPIRTSPGSLIFKENEESEITPLEVKGNLPWAEDKCEQKRQYIRKCFYNDWIRREKKDRETATGVMDDRDEMLRLFAPIFSRIAGELHGPLISRVYNLLDARGLIGPAPQSLRGMKLKVGYCSPAARAQLGSQAQLISAFIQDVIPLAQADPAVLDAIDLEKAVQELAILRGIPRTVLRSPEALAALKQQKAQMQSLAQAAQIAEPASKAVKNIADAQAVGAAQ